MNRRSFLKVIAALGTIPTALPLTNVIAQSASQSSTLLQVVKTERDPVRHLLGRIGYSHTPSQIQAIRQIGVDAYIDQQLNPESIDDAACEAGLDSLHTNLVVTVPDVYKADISVEREQQIADDLIGATVLRAMYSKRQLFEVMVNFWTDHFSVYHGKSKCQVLKTIDDREVIRKHALGKFRDLLGASAKSPAMLLYLDNALSHAVSPNENYAREVMELHTITPAHYTEADVKEVARAFTGWTFARQRVEAFMFDPSVHDGDAVTVLGTTIPAGGLEQGEQILDLLAAHPGTARHIATKLCRRFISDDPPESIIEQAAAAFRATDGDIRETVRTILNSTEFWSATPKFKRPLEFIVGIFRNLDIQSTSPLRQPIYRALRHMNHLPFNWLPPNGYSDRGTDWIGNFMERWNVVTRLLMADKLGYFVDPVYLGERYKVERDLKSLIRFYADHLLGRELTEAEYSAFTDFALEEIGAADVSQVRLDLASGRKVLSEIVAFMLMSADYQYR